MIFSIVTPCRNAERFIEETIRSVLAQEVDAAVQYVIQDGLSTDGTAEIVKRFSGSLEWRSEKDVFPSDAINKGFARCNGDIFGWINADDCYEPGALAAVKRAFEENPEAQWVAGYYRMVDIDGREIRRMHARYKHFLLRHYSHRLQLVENCFAQPSVFWRREAWESIGALDCLSPNRTAFDYELWLKLGKLGKPVIIPQVLSNFRYFSESISGSQTKALFNGELAYAKKEFREHPFVVPLHYLTWLRNRLLYNIWKL